MIQRGKNFPIRGEIHKVLAIIIVLGLPGLLAAQETSTTASASVSSTVTAPAPATHDPDVDLSLSAGLGAQDVEDELLKSSGAHAYFTLQGSHKFSKIFSAQLASTFYFAENTSADLYGNEGGSGSSVSIEYAHISIKPTDALLIDVGVLSRSFSTVPTTFRTDGALGAQESFLLGEKKNSYLELSTSQILPASSTAEQRAGRDRKMPLLLMAGGDVGLRLNDSTQWKIGAQYFQYSNLPSHAAHKSRQYNTVLGFSSNSARFVYRFEGVQAGTSVITEWNKSLKTTLQAGYIINREAAPGTGEGYAGSLAVDYKINKYVIVPKAGVYYNERNVLPAVYVASYGRTNRAVGDVSLTVKMPDEKLLFFGRYIQADLIENENLLSDRRIISLGMEATYDIL